VFDVSNPRWQEIMKIYYSVAPYPERKWVAVVSGTIATALVGNQLSQHGSWIFLCNTGLGYQCFLNLGREKDIGICLYFRYVLSLSFALILIVS
jgi:hypothetical protein